MATQKPSNFDDWWEKDGKFYDPDWSDVPWFDKRKDLAEYAWHRSQTELRSTVDRLEGAGRNLVEACKLSDSTEFATALASFERALADRKKGS